MLMISVGSNDEDEFYDETEASLMIIPGLTSHLGARTRNIQHSLILLQWKSSTPQICERH